MRRYECLEEGMEIEVLDEGGRQVRVELERVLTDLVFVDDLQTSDRTYLALDEDGRYVLYQDYVGAGSDGRVFATKALLCEFLWSRHEAMDLVLLDQLGLLGFRPPVNK